MKSKVYISIVLAALVAFVAACSNATKDNVTKLAELKAKHAETAKEIKRLEEEIAKSNPEAVKVKMKDVGVTEIAPRSFEHYVQTQGSVEAVDNILVSAKIPGIIVQVNAREGESVGKGQTLAQIDNSITMRNIEELKANIELANTVYERQKNLWDKKIGTEVQYLQAKNNKESLEKRLATLNEQLDMSRIKSPISGSVDEVDVKIGQNVAPGMAAFRVVSFDKLKVKANVSEAYATTIRPGDLVRLDFPDIKRKYDAKVTFVGKTINQLSRTFPIEVNLPSSSDLRPNMTAVLRVVYQTVPQAITVPVNVVQELNGQKIVYVAEKEGGNMVARKKVVEVVGVYDNLAEVNGLKAGEKIITVGYQGLNDGELIRL